jgi:hypothetical protein
MPIYGQFDSASISHDIMEMCINLQPHPQAQFPPKKPPNPPIPIIKNNPT